MQIKHDVVYDAANHLTLDIYGPDGVARGGIIQIHGGGWFRGDKAKDEDWAERWAARQYEVLVPNYRIAPAFHYPAAQADMETLMTWVKTAQLPFDKHHLAAVAAPPVAIWPSSLPLSTACPPFPFPAFWTLATG
ncbi:alpha/beta hydrolase fold domain-containing protein [Lacticaseibacillus camelliae]|uniref:alpha/beta hydrolase fold domain-containing protein n=1 Tax=Lacticaseibacillus camelliae TaxID=381742 RepID=UPI0034E269F2